MKVRDSRIKEGEADSWSSTHVSLSQGCHDGQVSGGSYLVIVEVGKAVKRQIVQFVLST